MSASHLETPTIRCEDEGIADTSRDQYGQPLHGIQLTCQTNEPIVQKSSSLLSAKIPEMHESSLSVNYPDADEEDTVMSLLYARHERIPMKDFSAEVRASLDVEHFLHDAAILLDVTHSRLEDIVDLMLYEMLSKTESGCSLEDAKSAFFTHDQVHQLAKTIQCTCATDSGGFDYDQSWICCFCALPNVQGRHIAIARLKHPSNFGRTSQEVQFVIMVVTPTKEKGTKNALETGRTFATLFSDIELRLQLLDVTTVEEFRRAVWEYTKLLAEEPHISQRGRPSVLSNDIVATLQEGNINWKLPFGKGLASDFKRRIGFYLSDYRDGFVGRATIHKMLAATFFLYFACILPSIAFGVLNDKNTDGYIDVRKVIYAQALGGLVFAVFGGQPLIIMLTTAPLALYIKVIFLISEQFSLQFSAMYCCVGLWNSVFLLIYAIFDVSKIMQWSTRSTEEIFGLFISIAFSVDAFKEIYYNFQDNYHSENCDMKGSNATLLLGNESSINASLAYQVQVGDSQPCLRENSLLYLLLVLGTLWIGMSLNNFTKTPFLNANKREVLADYALPVAVLLMSFFGSFVFKEVKLKPFNYREGPVFVLTPLQSLPWPAVFGAMGLGFCLSLLFFMDQNITAAMVQSPANRLRKGPALHWDLMVVGIINSFLSLFGMPWVHGSLPHSPLHVHALADMEDRVDQGHVHPRIVRVRETRVTGIFSHTLIGLSLLLLPYPMAYIPKAVLAGLFLIIAFTALDHSQLFERITLLVTEQAAYPPNHYIRSVPQRKVHLFTLSQLVQLAVLCGFGFSPIPYLKMFFPVLLLFLLPIRHKIIPRLIEKKYLSALDRSG